MDALRIVTKKDSSTAKGKLYLKIFEPYQTGEDFDATGAGMSNPEISDIVKTIRALENKSLYAHGYLRL